MFLVNGMTLKGFRKGKSSTNHLYRNLGKGRLQRRQEGYPVTSNGLGQGVCVGDFEMTAIKIGCEL